MQSDAVQEQLKRRLMEARVKLEQDVEEQIKKEREELLEKHRALMRAEVENSWKLEVKDLRLPVPDAGDAYSVCSQRPRVPLQHRRRPQGGWRKRASWRRRRTRGD